MGDITANPFELARIWVADHGESAPAEIRKWAMLPDQDEAFAEFLERIAIVAEVLLAEGRRAKAKQSNTTH